jgi:hypothetical protein
MPEPRESAAEFLPAARFQRAQDSKRGGQGQPQIMNRIHAFAAGASDSALEFNAPQHRATPLSVAWATWNYCRKGGTPRSFWSRIAFRLNDPPPMQREAEA